MSAAFWADRNLVTYRGSHGNAPLLAIASDPFAFKEAGG